jgi:hypothetical protein
MGFKGRNGREKTQGEIYRDEWNRLNGVYEKGMKSMQAAGGHIKGNKAMQAAGGHVKGGKIGIKKLLQWQRENDYSIGDLIKTDEHKKNISIALKKYCEKNPKSDKLRKQISDKIKENNSKLSDIERSKKFGNDSSSKKSLKVRTTILNTIVNDTFTTAEARKACEEYGLGNWKAFLKDNRIIKQIHKGTNNFNPSIYQKIK